MTSQPEASESPAIKPLRFSLDEAGLAALAASPLLAPAPSPARPRRVQDRFFDTENFALAHHGITLYLRKAGRGASMVLLHEGEMLRAMLPTQAPDLAAFGPDWQAALTGILKDAPLGEVASASLRQTIRKLGSAELAFETGHLTAHGQKLAFSELQISAPAATLPETALALAARFTLRLQPLPPGPRAVRLAGGPPQAVQKAAPGLQGEPCLDEAVQHVISACLDQFRANWAVFYEGDEVGAVHQMRVALRRLRSALGLFNRALPTPEFRTLREEAKRIAGTMGEARNWDVFIAMLHDGPAAAFPNEVGFVALEAQCTAHRQAGYKLVRELLEDPATTRFLLMAEGFIAKRGWRGGLPTEALPRLAQPARSFGAECLERLHRKVRKRGRHLGGLPAHDRHMVRIELKKLRYAAEFFGNLFAPRGRVRHFNRAAAALQEELGKLNDMATAEGLAIRLQGGTPEALRALGIVLGWTAHAALGDPRALNAAWKDFQDARLFT
ncbi:MAG TPA: CHAD domain-containing protein [Acidocella sp.]|nr:CHAD domain-containing protein [Acidocella sp.]